MTADWFPGAGRSDADEAFLAAARAAVDADGLVDATPSDTSVVTWEGVLLLLVELPGFQGTAAKPTLEVVWSGSATAGLMCGCETYGYLVDDYGAMDLEGIEPTVEALGRQAVAWFTTQLRRPVERATWSTWRGAVSLTRFADDDEPIWSDSRAWRRRRRPPDRLVALRPRPSGE